MTGNFSTLVHGDGAKSVYEIFGAQHLGTHTPIILVNGMSMLRGDWQRLADVLAEFRPVLIFDHSRNDPRGMGGSTLSTQGDEQVTLEMMARDLFDLLVALEWKEVAICGYSMGGAITQQLLFLPFHPTNPTPLPFRITHVFLTATLCEKLDHLSFGKQFQKIPPPANGRKRTFEEKREIARPIAESIFDITWLAQNPERFNWWLNQMTFGRPIQTILMQARAISKIAFEGLHEKIPKDIKILVIHGELDAVLPFSASREILRRLPQAQEVEVGNEPGQIPNLAFGHQWFEYFDIAVWREVFEHFLNGPPVAPPALARL